MLQKAELSCEADSENYLGGSSENMYYIGLDVHEKTITNCVKDAAGLPPFISSSTSRPELGRVEIAASLSRRACLCFASKPKRAPVRILVVWWPTRPFDERSPRNFRVGGHSPTTK